MQLRLDRFGASKRSHSVTSTDGTRSSSTRGDHSSALPGKLYGRHRGHCQAPPARGRTKSCSPHDPQRSLHGRSPSPASSEGGEPWVAGVAGASEGGLPPELAILGALESEP